jgi:hypothetical protein
MSVSEINKICGTCAFIDTKDGADSTCTIDNDYKPVGYWDKAKDCWESRTGMFDNEEMSFD